MSSKIYRINSYVAAVLLVFVATVLTQLLYSLKSSVSFTLFYAAIAITAWAGGAKPGLVAIILSIAYFFLRPNHLSAITASGHPLELALSVFVAFVINFLISELRNSHYQIRQLSDRHLQAEEQLRLAMQAAQVGMWNWDLNTGEIVWNQEHEQILGLTPGTFDGRYQTFDAHLHPDDREELNRAVQAAIQEHQPYRYEYRVIWADGSIHWVEGRGQAFYNEMDKPIRMTGTIINIDERKQTETALQESEMRFQALVDAVFEGILIQENGTIIDANLGFAEMFGYSIEEVIGKTGADFLTPGSLQIVMGHVQHQNELPYEIMGIKKDGTLINLEVVGKQSLYQGRKVRVSALRDVSDPFALKTNVNEPKQPSGSSI